MNIHVRRTLAATVGVVAALVWCTPAQADAVRDRQWYLKTLRIAEAHQISQGEGVTVGLIDSGVNATHPDLVGNVVAGTDLLRPPGDGLTPRAGHGTAMAGLIAAHGHGGGGVLGIAPKAKVLSVTTAQGVIVENTDLYAQGIQWAVQHGAKVLCIAFAADTEPALKAAVEAAIRADVVVVAGVGNLPESDSVRYPAAYPGVVAVAGVDQEGNHAVISVKGKGIVISAPSNDITSTASDGTYSTATGTSNSTAIVAGVAALIRAKYPQATAAEVVMRMTATAVDNGSVGLDDTYGYGVVNPVAALAPTVTAPASVSASPSAPPELTLSPVPETGSRRLVPVLAGVGVLLAAGAVTSLVLLGRRRARSRR